MSVEQLSFQQLSLNPSHPPSITLTKDPIRSRKARNRQYVPSDDEDDLTDNGDIDSDDSDDELQLVNKQRPSDRRSPSSPKISNGKQQYKKVTPLPSDDEDDDDDDDDDIVNSKEDDNTQSYLDVNNKHLYRLQGVQSTNQPGNYIPNSPPSFGEAQRYSADDANATFPSPSSTELSSYDSDDDCALIHQQKFHPGSSSSSVNSNGGGGGNDAFLTHGSQLQQWQHMQQHHQAQMAQFNYRQQQQQQRHLQQPHPIKSHSSSSHLRYQYHQQQQQQQQQHTLSGMELMTQLEHDKAEAKRQKPKLNPTHAKIQGLLAKLPEPGVHNINFQQVYQQQHQKHQKQKPHNQYHSHQHRLHQQQQHGFNRSSAASVGRSPSPTPSTRSCTPNMMMMQQQPLVTNPYMYGYPLPSHYHQQQQQHPSRSGSAMSMNRF